MYVVPSGQDKDFISQTKPILRMYTLTGIVTMSFGFGSDMKKYKYIYTFDSIIQMLVTALC